MITLVCQVCNASYTRTPYAAKGSKHCSRVCHNKIAGRASSKPWAHKIAKAHIGMKAPWLTKRNLENNPAKIGAESSQWKGEDVAYITLHSWIARIIEKKECARCKAKENLQYANKSGKYTRDVSDWFVLCAKCHYHYDRVEMAGTYRKFRNRVKQEPAS